MWKQTAGFALAVLLGVAAGSCAIDPVRGDGGTAAPLCSAGDAAAIPVDPAAMAPPDCTESCNTAAGLTFGCGTRFAYGVNYAWSAFGADFGGIAPSTAGVSRSCRVGNDLRDMRQNGVDVVRWWVWPQFRSDGVAFDASNTPTGLGGTVLEDLEAALALAAEAGVHIQFCLFSFDNFRMDRRGGIKAIVQDPVKRAALMELAVRPFVRAAMASPHNDRVISWDVINEPEWAITGANPYGDPLYTPQSNLQPVTHAEMETFVADVIAAIRAESDRQITVGSTGAKWPRAWSNVDIDFYTIHLYDWLNRDYPYDRSPADLGLTGKPVVMGEFPLGGLTGASYDQMLSAFLANGYAGALAWSVTDRNFGWPANKGNVKAFAEAKGCLLRY